jgi:signal peptidase I
MRETIVEEDRVMILKFLHFDELERGDIIVFYPPVKGKEDVPYIKRLIGVPGDKVVVKDGALYLNDKKQDEPYVRDSYINYSADFGTVPIGDDVFFEWLSDSEIQLQGTITICGNDGVAICE